MKLFESSWRDGFQFYERVLDTELNKSMKKEVKALYEWYEPSSNGMYSYILDENIKLDKKMSSSSKDGRDKYGFIDPLYKNIRDSYWNKNAYNLKPRTFYLDIETRTGQNGFTGFPKPEHSNQEICLMQFYDTTSETMFVLGNREWNHQSDYKFDYKIQYINCKNEIELLETYLKIFQKLDPLVIYAWNGSGFDYPYIFNRLKNLGFDTNRLSNYGKCSLNTSEYQGRTEFKFTSDGHHYIDLMVIYKKFTFKPRASYSLNSIAEIEVNDKKVDHSEYEKFDDFYSGNYTIPKNPTSEQKNSKIYKEAINGNIQEVRELAYSDFVYYGIKDTYLIKQIDDKLKFTQLQLMISEKMGVLLSDATGTVRPWSQYISNRSYVDNKIMPFKKDNPHPNVVGGYVKDPIKGKHKYVLSVDVNSMYPLLGMVGFNMSPETYVSKANLPADLKEIVLKYFNDQNEENRLNMSEDIWDKTKELLNKYNMSLGINGAVFTKDKLGMIPEMVLEIYNGRKKAKNKMLEFQQQKVNIKEILERKKNECK